MQMEDSHSQSNGKTLKVEDRKIRIDNLQKVDSMKHFIRELNEQPQIAPFLDLGSISRWGVMDFQYINGKTLSLHKIYLKVKNNSYQFFHDFIKDLTKIFIAVSDYCFADDQIQVVCEKFIDKIRQFQRKFVEQFREKGNKKQKKKHSSVSPAISVRVSDRLSKSPSQDKQQQNGVSKQDASNQELVRGPSNLLQKLRMAHWLRQNEGNELKIRQLASCLKNYRETATEIIVQINNSSWQQFLNMRRA